MCVDQDKLLYHFLVEGTVIKDGSKVQCDVGVKKYFYNSPVSNSPKPLDNNTKDASVQGWPQAEEKYSQIPAGKC